MSLAGHLFLPCRRRAQQPRTRFCASFSSFLLTNSVCLLCRTYCPKSHSWPSSTSYLKTLLLGPVLKANFLVLSKHCQNVHGNAVARIAENIFVFQQPGPMPLVGFFAVNQVDQ